jgi:hypothetical protein
MVALGAAGFDGRFQPDFASKSTLEIGAELGYCSEGSAVFWKREVFELVVSSLRAERLSAEDGSGTSSHRHCAVVSVLRHIDTAQEVRVVNGRVATQPELQQLAQMLGSQSGHTLLAARLPASLVGDASSLGGLENAGGAAVGQLLMHSQSLACRRWLGEADDKACVLPSFQYPSDVLSAAATFVLPAPAGTSDAVGAAKAKGERETQVEAKAAGAKAEALTAWREGLSRPRSAFLSDPLLDERVLLEQGLKKGKEVKIRMAKAWKLVTKGKGGGLGKVRLAQCSSLAAADKERHAFEMSGPLVDGGKGLVPPREAYIFFLLLLRPVLQDELGEGGDVEQKMADDAPARWEVEVGTEGELWVESERMAAVDADRHASEAQKCLASATSA